jgi:hypothetical protein
LQFLTIEFEKFEVIWTGLLLSAPSEERLNPAQSSVKPEALKMILMLFALSVKSVFMYVSPPVSVALIEQTANMRITNIANFIVYASNGHGQSAMPVSS